MNVQHVPVFLIASLLKHIYITLDLQVLDVFPNTSKTFFKKISLLVNNAKSMLKVFNRTPSTN